MNASLITGLSFTDWLAVSGLNLLVSDYNSGTIGEYTTFGVSVNASLITGLNGPYGVAVSGSNLFVVNARSGTIGEYTTSGSTVNSSLIMGLSGPVGIAVVLVPEPSTPLLVATGVVDLAFRRRRARGVSLE